MDGFSMLLVAATFSSAASFSLGRVPMPTAPSAVRMSAIDDAEVSAHADRMHGLDHLRPCCAHPAATLLRPASLCDLHAAGQGALACGERHAVVGRDSMVKVPPLAVPQLGSCASSGRAWRLYRRLGTPGKRPALWAPSHCLGCSR